ncbi:MAG: PTS sugar transporter subunit IIA [Spirochaetes bacterium]|nr:PTS sugar transporter subunit IIA [Spirochaetota bacterium]
MKKKIEITVKYDLLTLLDKEDIFFPELTDKKELLDYCVAHLSKDDCANLTMVKELIHKREELMSTGIGYGIAFPHIRNKSINRLTIKLALIKKGIDWEAFDGMPVHIIFFFIIPEKHYANYLTLIAKISSIFKEEKNRKQIIQYETPEEVLKFLAEKML